ALPRGRAADGVVGGALRDDDAGTRRAVAERAGAVRLEADVVAFDDVAGRVGAVEENALDAVAADDVACRGRRAADRVVRRDDVDAEALVASRRRAVRGDAEVVAGHGVAAAAEQRQATVPTGDRQALDRDAGGVQGDADLVRW